MDLRSLVPLRSQNTVMRPDISVFGTLQREVDRLFNDFARGVSAGAPPSVTGTRESNARTD